jgi:hypothetical protein
MNRVERQLLRDTIRAVSRHNGHAWWQLKREIFDYGSQSFYPAQAMFDGSARLLLSRLPPASLRALRDASGRGELAHSADSDLIERYVSVVVSEIVRRAEVAAYRTINW